MAAIAYKCPACGCYLTDDVNKDILVCPHCGTSLTKEIGEAELERRDRRELLGIFRKRETDGTRGLALMLAGCVIFGLIAHYLGI